MRCLAIRICFGDQIKEARVYVFGKATFVAD